MKDDVVRGSGVMREMKSGVAPFDASLWAYTARHSGNISSKSGHSLLKHTYKMAKMPVRMSAAAPVRQLAREIKMMSLNPSVYGNVNSVLGSS
jgi:hypothetical protein